MSEENKNRDRDKGNQNNGVKYKNQAPDVELATENESKFFNLDNKRNKRKRDGDNEDK